MAGVDKDNIPMLSDTNPSLYDEQVNSQFGSLNSSARNESVLVPIQANPFSYTGPLRSERKAPFPQMSGPLLIKHNPVGGVFQSNTSNLEQSTKEPMKENFRSLEVSGWAGWSNRNDSRKNEHLLKSGQLGQCNDPYCTTCPTYNIKTAQRKSSRASGIFEHKFHNALYGDAKGWARKFGSFLQPCIPRVMNPHTKIIQKWNKFFVISCLVAIFLDPLFFFLLSVQQANFCIVLDWPMTTALVVFRSVTDFIYILHILLQFRLAYVAPESRVVGAGELVDHPKKIARNYLRGFFVVDLFVALPLPQIIILLILPRSLGTSGANYAKNLLRAAILVQYIPKLSRFLPLLIGQTPSGFVFESAWANFVLNLFTFMLSAHVVGSFWYLFGLQRVNQCFRDACQDSGIQSCMTFIDCGHGDNLDRFDSYPTWQSWTNNTNASSCLSSSGAFSYGIYGQAVDLTLESSIVTRYIYSLFWGFLQISTLAGNQVPSYFVWEVLFTMAIIGLGLLLFALLIGNMQNFLQALGQRRSKMSLRRRDVELWMGHRRLPEELRRQVREAERYSWAATRGVNEETLLENLPEDLQRNIRRHLFTFLKKVRIFSLMDEPILDSIREKLRQKTYIKGSEVFFNGGFIEKMVFIVRGKMESCGADGIVLPLSEGDVCGEELLTWCLEHSSVYKDGKRMGISGQRLISNRTVHCLTNVEAFSLHAADIEQVTSVFARFLRNQRVQGAIRYESPYWRCLAANRIQVAWRYRKKRQTRVDSLRPEEFSSYFLKNMYF